MKKDIEIYIVDKDDFLEKYNEEKVSGALIEYIINQTKLIRKKERIRLVINKKCELDYNCVKMIKDGLKDEYNKSIRTRDDNNIRQLFFFILGIIFIFLSILIKEESIWKEILLITGWVPIWEMIEVELFPDVEGRKRRNIIRKLLNSDMVEKIAELKESKKASIKI